MMAGHFYELIIVFGTVLIPVLFVVWFVRFAARTAGREFARARSEEERRQRLP